MVETLKFFSIPQNKQLLITTSAVLMAHGAGNQGRESAVRLSHVLRIISNNAEEFDRVCQINLRWIGSNLIDNINNLQTNQSAAQISFVSVQIYRIIAEFEMSTKQDLSMELRQFKTSIQETYSQFPPEIQRQVDFARTEMPVLILKELLTSDDVNRLRDLSELSNGAQQKISDWSKSLDEAEKRVEKLAESLKQQEGAFNFVGLHKGFENLEMTVVAELADASRNLRLFGVALLLPAMLDLIFVFSGELDSFQNKVHAITGAAIASVTLTVLLLYFFRVTLRTADSCKAQLVQIRLRMTLCAFIQSYAEYSREINEKNAGALAKFEALIFSGIVSTDDKLPSTFDGVDQISTLLKSLRT